EDSLDVLVYHRGSDSPQVGSGCVVCGEEVYAKARCKNCYQNARRAGEAWCRLKECLEPVSIKSRGLCNKHYLRLRKWGFYERCLRDGCESEVYSKDFCLKHYTEAWRRQKIKK